MGEASPDFGYRFSINIELYRGLTSEDKVLKVDDSVCVVNLPMFLSVNRSFSYFYCRKIKRDCK